MISFYKKNDKPIKELVVGSLIKYKLYWGVSGVQFGIVLSTPDDFGDIEIYCLSSKIIYKRRIMKGTLKNSKLFLGSAYIHIDDVKKLG
jgi:hypothetical protein